MKIRPVQDRIVVRRVAEEEKTKGKPAEGEVVAVGPGKANDKGVVRPLDVKKGDRVLFGKYSGNEIKLEGVEHIILREDEVLGIIEK
jgi:chaperonin GroES